jgi:hypothetical protein
MAPFFGSKDDDGGAPASDDAATLDAEIARLDGLPLAELAGEAMSTGFGPDGPGGPGKPGTIDGPPEAYTQRLVLVDIVRCFTPAFVGKGVSQAQQLRLQTLVAEGLQILENASLVRITWRGDQEHYMATRRGRKALADGTLDGILSRLDLE